jgi:hypothetical protein
MNNRGQLAATQSVRQSPITFSVGIRFGPVQKISALSVFRSILLTLSENISVG